MFFIQMSGFPGSGKSTLSKQIAKTTGAVLIDHDIVKSALLESIEDNMDNKLAGKISYNIDWSLIESHLSHGQNVIFDSPCLYDEMIIRGTHLCNKYNVRYKYVECYLDDINEINLRLRIRNSMISQIKEVISEEGFKHTINNSKKPANLKCLLVDTSMPLESYLQKVMDYINE
jgi:predicted kinase